MGKRFEVDGVMGRVCTNPECHMAELWQPESSFSPQKSRCKTCCKAANSRSGRERSNRRRTSFWAVEREKVPRLALEPWGNWLEQQLTIMSSDELCIWLGLPPRRLWGWMHARPGERVTLDRVDQALCYGDVPHLLREIYPELYDEKERAA